jgi:hypothetical protein
MPDGDRHDDRDRELDSPRYRRADNGDDPTFVRITNAMVYAELQATRADLRDLAKAVADYPDQKKRVRSLELKFYGVLAGLISALAVVGLGAIR